MGAKASLVVEGLGPGPGPGPGSGSGPALAQSVTLENIQAAYEDGEELLACELIQRAYCVDCSAGTPPVSGVSHCTPKNTLHLK